MPDQRLTTTTPELQPIVDLVLDSLTSAHSRRAYSRALTDFLAWYLGRGRPGLSKALVQSSKVVLQSQGLAPSTINQRMSAIRKLADEAADNGLIERALANGIARVHSVKAAHGSLGAWR